MSSQCICVKDFESLARDRLPGGIWAFYDSGATDEQTVKDNVEAFARWRFQPRILRDVSKVDMAATILGKKVDFPICITATAQHKTASVNGEIDSARAAASLGSGFTLSTWATTSLEEIAEHIPTALRWFQLYVFKDRALTQRLVRRAEKSGFSGIMVTVDHPVLGRRYRDARNKYSLPSHLRWKNFDVEKSEKFEKGIESKRDSGLAKFTDMVDAGLTWSDFDWLKSITTLPIVVKGILTAEDAREAVQHGVDGILVSNHGGRQLDGVLATIDALPQVVRAVDGKCDVYLDGGVRSGGDVAKAIALGAKAVFIGRPILWGLAVDGEAGVRRVLEILRDEFELTMKLLGVRSIAELQSSPNMVIHESQIARL